MSETDDAPETAPTSSASKKTRPTTHRGRRRRKTGPKPVMDRTRLRAVLDPDSGPKVGAVESLPGAQKDLRTRYPNCGTEDEYWTRCEEATTLFVRGMSYVKIGARLDCTASMAHRMVRRWLRGAARFFPAVEQRELIAHHYRQLQGMLMNEFAVLMRTREQGGPDIDDADRVRLKIDLIKRMEDNLFRQSQLFGFAGAGTEINIFPAEREEARSTSLPSLEDAKKIRRLVRMQRAIMQGKPVDALFADVEEKPNGKTVAAETMSGTDAGESTL